jgi:hypothetical protein
VLALALALGGLAAAWRWLPPIRGGASLPAVPPMELRLRLVAAFVLAAVILWSAPIFGAVVSGVLLSLPITGSIMPPFTLALYGSDAVARLTRGFVVGLCGFTAFFFTVAATATTWGITASFLAAVGAALGAIFAVSHAARPHRP